MKKYSRLLATTVAVTMVSGTLVTPAQAETVDKDVAGYTVSVDTTAETCTITPTDTAVQHTRELGDAMWPGAKQAALSTELPWAPGELAKIDAARKAGHKSGEEPVTTPMAALEALSPLATGQTLANIWDTLKNMPFLKNILGALPNYSVGDAGYKFAVGIIKDLFKVDKLMQPGELAGHFLNPAVNASSPVVASEGKTFTFTQAQTEAKNYQRNIDSPPYATLFFSNTAKTQAAKLPVEFKQAWAAYNTDAVNVFKACSAGASAETIAPTDPATIDPETLPNIVEPEGGNNGDGGNNGNGGNDKGGSSDSKKQGSTSEMSSQVDNADKLSALMGNENGSSNTTNTLIGVGVGVGVLALLGLLFSAIPMLKPFLPPHIARLIP